MFDELPSLREFQPNCFTGGPCRHHLPLLYDLVRVRKPGSVVTIGFGDGQAHFVFCQAAKEADVSARCIALRAHTTEDEREDEAWLNGRESGSELYGEVSELRSEPWSAVMPTLPPGSVDLLFIDDIDSGAELAAVLSGAEPTLSPDAIVLFHGISLERMDSPGAAWKAWASRRRATGFAAGLGLGVASFRSANDGRQQDEDWLFDDERSADLGRVYRLAAERIEARHHAAEASHENAALNARQIWLDAVLDDRAKAQKTLDEQARALADLRRRFDLLQQDRTKAQVVMESQAKQVDDRTQAQRVLDEQAKMIADLQRRFDVLLSDRIKAQAVLDAQAQQLETLEVLRRDRAKAQLVIDAQAEQLKGVEVLRRDRAKAQLVIDAQAEQLKGLEALRADRAKAQLVMDAQLEQLRQWTATADRLGAERDELKRKLKEQKELLKFAKTACRKNGKCFHRPDGKAEKKSRSISEKILREIKRVPRKLLGGDHNRSGAGKKPESGAEKAPAAKTASPDPPAGAQDGAVPKDSARYARWIEEHEPDQAALERQRQEVAGWNDPPRVSLLTPVYNTPARFLEELLASILAQTFPHWELCIIDAGSTNPETLAVLQKQSLLTDSRIRIQSLKENLGIAENTNRALETATGDFFACVDHDDLLSPFALYSVAKAIREWPDADVIYSDEDRCDVNGHRHAPFFKPEWSPALLTSFMYLGHLTAFRRSLAGELGGFRKEFDLSQDYDFALRATERAREIKHVPQVLYHWREHPASGSMGGKPDARATNLAALADAMRRRNLPAQVIEYPTANRARLRVDRWPRVSIIVPTDSPTRAQICASDLVQKTTYPDLEVVIVTNSTLAENLERSLPADTPVKLVRYDKPFNFSDKCNVGATAASGERLVFYNDDVEPTDAEWIQELTEQLGNPEVGATAPKMLYETGKIQHAGLVTGVRGLVGTACHQWPGDSADYSNFAQSLRDVSALSAACLAMRKEDFVRLGGFDEVNTPIAHSDLELCFKVREAGLRCVYTPFTTMIHRGHASIGALEAEEHHAPADKASVYLLKRWGGFSSHDPYYPENIRDWLYYDSPTPIRMWGRNQPDVAPQTRDLLFVTHDLSWSGAPLILSQVATWCSEHGFFVTVMSPEDGPLREKFADAGIPVIVDSLVMKGHPSFTSLAREFDCVVASTIFGAPVVLAASSAGIPHLWWIHEGRVAEHYLNEDRNIRLALGRADFIVTPDTRSAQIYQPFTDRAVRVMTYGIPEPRPIGPDIARAENGRVSFLVLGTIEQRKGQRVVLDALRQLPEDVLAQLDLQIVGRPHDSEIVREVEEAARQFPQLTYGESVNHEGALDLIRNADVVVSASWDETGPLILMEALALGKPILSTNVGAVAEHLAGEDAALFFGVGDASALAASIEQVIRTPDLIERLGKNARVAYEKYFTFDRFARAFAESVYEASRADNSPSATAPVG